MFSKLSPLSNYPADDLSEGKRLACGNVGCNKTFGLSHSTARKKHWQSCHPPDTDASPPPSSPVQEDAQSCSRSMDQKTNILQHQTQRRSPTTVEDSPRTLYTYFLRPIPSKVDRPTNKDHGRVLLPFISVEPPYLQPDPELLFRSFRW